MSDIKQIGEKLVGYCKEGRNMDAVNELYADDVVSVEAAAWDGGSREVAGKEAVVGKGTWWVENNEVHSAEVNGPYPHGDDRFAVRFNYDVTFKPTGKRSTMDEVGVFHVANGKIVREEFFYNMG